MKRGVGWPIERRPERTIVKLLRLTNMCRDQWRSGSCRIDHNIEAVADRTTVVADKFDCIADPARAVDLGGCPEHNPPPGSRLIEHVEQSCPVHGETEPIARIFDVENAAAALGIDALEAGDLLTEFEDGLIKPEVCQDRKAGGLQHQSRPDGARA